MKKHLVLISALVLAAALGGCAAGNPGPEPAPAPEQSAPQETPSSAITDISEPAVGLHEEIVKQTFAEGEEIDSLYYKRSVNDEGTAVYTVTRKSDGQTVNLPMTETVVYVTRDGPSYYEKVTVTYKEDGDPTSIEQYELYVQSTEEIEPVSPEEHPDVIVKSSGHSAEAPGTIGTGGMQMSTSSGSSSSSGAKK